MSVALVKLRILQMLQKRHSRAKEVIFQHSSHLFSFLGREGRWVGVKEIDRHKLKLELLSIGEASERAGSMVTVFGIRIAQVHHSVETFMKS